MMTVYRNQGRWDTSNVRYESGRVVLYDKALGAAGTAGMEFIDYGLSMLRRDLIAGRLPPSGRADLADMLHQLSLDGLLAGFEARHRFYEVGTPAGLAALEAFLQANDDSG
jgi:hypothetical protein